MSRPLSLRFPLGRTISFWVVNLKFTRSVTRDRRVLAPNIQNPIARSNKHPDTMRPTVSRNAQTKRNTETANARLCR
jgi:hypothetical protein